MSFILHIIWNDLNIKKKQHPVTLSVTFHSNVVNGFQNIFQIYFNKHV